MFNCLSRTRSRSAVEMAPPDPAPATGDVAALMALNRLVLGEAEAALERAAGRPHPYVVPSSLDPKRSLRAGEALMQLEAHREAMQQRTSLMADWRSRLQDAQRLNTLPPRRQAARAEEFRQLQQAVGMRETIRFDPLVNPERKQWLQHRFIVLAGNLRQLMDAPESEDAEDSARIMGLLGRRFEPAGKARMAWQQVQRVTSCACAPHVYGPPDDYRDLELAQDRLQEMGEELMQLRLLGRQASRQLSGPRCQDYGTRRLGCDTAARLQDAVRDGDLVRARREAEFLCRLTGLSMPPAEGDGSSFMTRRASTPELRELATRISQLVGRYEGFHPTVRDAVALMTEDVFRQVWRCRDPLRAEAGHSAPEALGRLDQLQRVLDGALGLAPSGRRLTA